MDLSSCSSSSLYFSLEMSIFSFLSESKAIFWYKLIRCNKNVLGHYCPNMLVSMACASHMAFFHPEP